MSLCPYLVHSGKLITTSAWHIFYANNIISACIHSVFPSSVMRLLWISMALNSLLYLNVSLWKLSHNCSWIASGKLFFTHVKNQHKNRVYRPVTFCKSSYLSRDIPPGLYGEHPAAVQTGRRAIYREALESWSWKTPSLGSGARWQTPGNASSTAVYLTYTRCTPVVIATKTGQTDCSALE